jgi:alkanesulfonate monooxygenase SsuD/methylene tetrahydromethanopterin reductase-like flavin-dependent oxidoreductase (luciferase family)
LKLGVVVIPRQLSETDKRPLVEQLTELAQNIEKLGFEGLWVTDAFARGWATLDPLTLLGALSSVTNRIELGTCVVQIPIRHPVEHAHRVQTLNLLSNGRLRFGIGSGSTKHDFDAVQADFDRRFKTLTEYFNVMERVWAGEAVYGPALSVWPGTEGGPQCFLGAWRSPRWINMSARIAGWIASGIYGTEEDLRLGVKMFREANGKRAILANIFTDMRPEGKRGPVNANAKQTLYCTPAEAKDRLKRFEDMGFDDALLVVPDGDPGQLETMRSLI